MTALYDIIVILPFSLLTVMLLGGYAGMPAGSIIGIVLCLISSLWIIMLRHMKNRDRLRSIGVVCVFLAGLIIAAGEEYRQLFIKEYIWTAGIILISAAAAAAGMLMTAHTLVRRIAAALLLIYCIVSAVFGRDIGKEAFPLICFILLVRIAEEIQLGWKKSGQTDIKEHITKLSPILLAVCLTVYIIPAPDTPFDWQFAKDIWNYGGALANRIIGSIAHPSDEYGNIGFSDSGSFIAGLGRNNDEDVLIITADSKKIKELRLVGCISGEFTGRQWIFDTDRDSVLRTADTIETLCAFKKHGVFPVTDHIMKAELRYETLFYNTRYIFSPAKIRLRATKEKNIGSESSVSEISEKNGSMISKKRLNYTDEYYISCYLVNHSDPELKNMLCTAAPITKEEWELAAADETAPDGSIGCSYEDYRNYRNDIYSLYCHTYEVSDRTAEIIDGIKNSSRNRYEAAKALEDYFKNMEYSTDCGALPDHVRDAGSFLDYFLFESKKGYCMHYATAFVLMANEMGIPCRYVQGYNTAADADGTFTVRQSSAHAWPEVYFDNAGWIAFEPTPGFSVPTGWKTNGNKLPSPEPQISIPYSIPQPEQTADEPDIPAEEKSGIDPLILIIPAAGVVCFLVLFYLVSRLVSRRRYSRMSSYDKYRFITAQSLRFLAHLGYRMEEGETLSEFRDRIAASDDKGIKEQLGFIPVYETVLYSTRGITEDDLTAAERICDTLRTAVKKNRPALGLLMMISRQ
ncbi:MAG: transglutaminase domain-containing protein [Oscillospiraceae bacterium]|nr:transglutaminase domain-containing protein [Oscillospiraceae bacterium]